jgi:HEAT repeat protein
VRIAALHALGALDAPALSEVATELLGDADEDLAAAALSAVARLSDPRVDALLEAAALSSNLACRVPAAQAIAARGGARAAEMLAWAARLGEPAELPGIAIEGLRKLSSGPAGETTARAVDALLGLAAEPDHRAAALAALATLPESSVDALAAALRSTRLPTRVAAVEALARMRQPRASQALAEALRDEDAAVRGAAVGAFGRLGTPSVGAAIARMALADPDTGVRRRAQAICGRHGWKDVARP